MGSFDPYAHVIHPMLAEARETPFDSADHIFELKWDGTRALAFVRNGRHRFQNRRLSFIEARYPDIVPRTKGDAILDGEIVVMDGALPSFEKLQEREKASGTIRVNHLARTLPATYIAFDILYAGDRDVMRLPQMERKALLRETVAEDEHVVLSDFVVARGVDYYRAVVDRGLEGVIAKRRDARYTPGRRSPDWIKIKKKATQDCVIAGVTVGEGERGDTFGSLVLGAYHEGQLVHVGRVGTGFSEALRRALTARLAALRQDVCPFAEAPELEVPLAFWTSPQVVAEIHFLEWSKDRHMRAPSFSHLREDKLPADCVATFA